MPELPELVSFDRVFGAMGWACKLAYLDRSTHILQVKSLLGTGAIVRLLVAEDDERSAGYLVRGLTESGHTVDRAGDGETALAMALEGIYEALILDRKLPGLDGLTIVRRLRQRDKITPVLMLSGVAATVDRVEGLRAGCDDYLTKPYSFAELLARLEAVARRADRSHRQSTLRVGDLELDTVSRTISRSGRTIDLQRREFLLLEHLLRHAGQVVTRSMLLEAAWTYDSETHGNIVDMHIHRLRRKIDDGFTSRLIHTVPGAGYMIRESEVIQEAEPPAATPLSLD
jgi:two-component system OmpR family response regulator